MIFNGKEIEFPAIAKISFYKVIETLEKQAKDKERMLHVLLKNYLKKVIKSRN